MDIMTDAGLNVCDEWCIGSYILVGGGGRLSRVEGVAAEIAAPAVVYVCIYLARQLGQEPIRSRLLWTIGSNTLVVVWWVAAGRHRRGVCNVEILAI